MRATGFLFGLTCLLLFGCSHPILIMERPVADGYLVVVKLSDEGLVEQETGRCKLPYTVAGKSDIVVRSNHVYVATYKWL